MIDIQRAKRRTRATVLTLMRIAKHQVPPRKTHCDARSALVAQEVHHPRNPEFSTDDGKGVVFVAQRQLAPELEIVRIASLVERQRGSAIKKDDGALHRRHLHRDEVAIQHQYWE